MQKREASLRVVLANSILPILQAGEVEELFIRQAYASLNAQHAPSVHPLIHALEADDFDWGKQVKNGSHGTVGNENTPFECPQLTL